MYKSKFFQGYETSYYETFGWCILQATGRKYLRSKAIFSSHILAGCLKSFHPWRILLKWRRSNQHMPMIWILPSIFFKIDLCLTCGLHFTYYRWQLDQSFFYCTTKITSLQYLGDHHPQPAFFTQPIVCSIFYNCQILI